MNKKIFKEYRENIDKESFKNNHYKSMKKFVKKFFNRKEKNLKYKNRERLLINKIILHEIQKNKI